MTSPVQKYTQAAGMSASNNAFRGMKYILCYSVRCRELQHTISHGSAYATAHVLLALARKHVACCRIDFHNVTWAEACLKTS